MPPKGHRINDLKSLDREWVQLMNSETPVITTLGCFMRALVAAIRTGAEHPIPVNANQAATAANALLAKLAEQGDVQQVGQLIVLQEEHATSLKTDDNPGNPDNPGNSDNPSNPDNPDDFVILPASDLDPKKTH